MPTYGLLSTGFSPKPQDVCRSEISVSVQQKRGTSCDVSDGSLIGMMIGIFSEREASLWDLGQAIYSSQDPDTAVGSQQDAVCALTGTRRATAKKSTVLETLTGSPSTVVSYAQAKTTSTGAIFETTSSSTIVALTAWAALTVYTPGDRRTNASRAYLCITGGTSAASGGPTTTSPNITDGTVHWRYLGDGTGAVDVNMTSLVADSIIALSGDLNLINTPIGGLQSVINVLDAVPGSPEQTDASLRLTRESELQQEGSGTADSIRGKILDVTGVTTCTVYHNESDVVDSNGLPPHSILALVENGLDAAIAQVLFDNVPAGIVTVGTTTVGIVDSQGNTQNMSFTRPTSVLMYGDITLSYNPAGSAAGGYPTNGDALVKTSFVNLGNSMPAGKDAVAKSLGAGIFPLFSNGVLVIGVQGVLDATTLIYNDVIGTAAAWIPTHSYVATPGSRSVVTNDGGRTYICITGGTSAGSGGPTGEGTDITDNTVHWRFLGATFTITAFQRAVFDTSRVNVHSTPGTV